ncbi:MAG: divalent metal cation transporter [Planctomycetales bacterium]|nr:divalent metal cation transporter [Planctomycetales bacterium]
MNHEADQIAADRQLLVDAKQRGAVATTKAFIKLSGPGWLQSAITLGGGSLTGALYLGVLGGYTLLWLQPVAIVMGVIMLSAIGYVALSTGQRPFDAINRHISPALGWGWALATLAANMVWSLPQFSLSTAAVQQNLLPGLFGEQSRLGMYYGKFPVVAAVLIVAIGVIWIYDSHRWGVKIFETTLKLMVAVVVLSFVGVVVKMALSGDGLDWDAIFAGFVPRLSQWNNPAPDFAPFIDSVGSEFQSFWRDKIVAMQRDVMITAAATAVGINMTFLLPYSMLRRGWDREFRGLAVFDLSTGMAIPFVIVTGCIVIASATQFHTKPGEGLLDDEAHAPANLQGDFGKLLDERLVKGWDVEDPAATPEQLQQRLKDMPADEHSAAVATLPTPDRTMAAMLVKRDAFNLANSLEPLTGRAVANVIFGIGVLGMGMSTIIILMLINGFVICEIAGLPQGGMAHRFGCLIVGIGALGPFFWKEAAAWLAVPTSVFGMMLLPIAYFTFFFMMNSESLLGEYMPRGAQRLRWNILMGVAATLSAVGALWSVWSKSGWLGITAVAAFVVLAALTSRTGALSDKV